MDTLKEYQHNYENESLWLNKDYTISIICSNELINRFIKLLNLQFTIYHNVSDYSNQLGIKPKSLLRLLKKEGLKNPSDIIKLKLLFEAKRMLVDTNKSIREICFVLGFSDPAYFSRFFKKHTGITAQNFRNQYANKQSIVEMENSAMQ